MDRELEVRMQAFRKTCRDHGLRITPQRIAIYKRLVASTFHPTATDIYKQIKDTFPNISLGTVNTTLITFADIGLARIVEASGDPKRFDPDLEPHHHFRCVKCGRIIDFHNKAWDDIKIPAEITDKHSVISKSMHLDGLCNRCQGKDWKKQ
jgi:Fur family peroxide stress response transcriptional regulator